MRAGRTVLSVRLEKTVRTEVKTPQVGFRSVSLDHSMGT